VHGPDLDCVQIPIVRADSSVSGFTVRLLRD